MFQVPKQLFTIAICVLVSLMTSPGFAQDRQQTWNADIDFLAKELKEKHANVFHTLSESEFEEKTKELKSAIAKSDDKQMELLLHRFVANIGDAHTVVSHDFKKWRYFGFNLKVFDDGLFVVASERNNKAALGGKVVKIGAFATNEFWENYGQVVPHDNEPGLKQTFSTNSNIAEFLHAAGAIDSLDKIQLTVEKDGETINAIYQSNPFNKLTPQLWLTVKPKQLALYATKPRLSFWNDWIPQSSTLYFKYNRCRDPNGFNRLVNGTKGFIQQNDVEKFVIDLRDNPGGNSMVFRPLLNYLKNNNDLNQKGKLFVIIGRQTFSSGIFNAMEMQSQTNAILVGQATAGRPNHYGEIKMLELPNSKIKVQYSTKYHVLLRGSDPETLEPDVKVEFTFADYENGNDPSLEAVLKYAGE